MSFAEMALEEVQRRRWQSGVLTPEEEQEAKAHNLSIEEMAAALLTGMSAAQYEQFRQTGSIRSYRLKKSRGEL